MKVTICGKGGCGKSTVSTLLANKWAANGKRVLVVDGDESNFGLAQLLGKEQPREYIEELGGKESVLPALRSLSAGAPSFFTKPWTMESLPGGIAPGEIKLMSVGKIHAANEGCACAFNAVLAQLLDNLTLTDDDVVVMDMEAGVEHFGRGTDNSADAIVMVIDPTAESIKLAAKVHDIADQLGKPLYYVLNKLEEGDAPMIYRKLDDPSLVVAELPAHSGIRRSGLDGTPLQVQMDAVDAIVARIGVQQPAV